MNLEECINTNTTPDQRVVFNQCRAVSNDDPRHLEQNRTRVLKGEQNISFYSFSHRISQQINVGLYGSTVHHLGCPAADAMALNNKFKAIDVVFPG